MDRKLRPSRGCRESLAKLGILPGWTRTRPLFRSTRVGSRQGTVTYCATSRSDRRPGRRSSTCTAARAPVAPNHFDARRHRGILLDQRSAGHSIPHASEQDVHWASIDMDHHVADVERLRSHLGIDRWVVFGISWGSVLGITYAQRHPDQVSAVVLAAVSTGTEADIDWLTVHA
ncbi:MAG TPA: alpha/beta fold hydrolase, partial [Jatrophihabitans sp.]|nr:alpha/beta fold hydrolase [Jatrophihabitans sp.]